MEPVIAASNLSCRYRRTDAVRINESDIPFGASASRLLRWLRQRIDAQMAAGGDWRSVIDAIRPYTQRLWHELPLASRRRRSTVESLRP